MNRTVFLIYLFFIIIFTTSCANEINYNICRTLQEVIIRETQEIAATNPANFHELAHLYVARGESYLLNRQYQQAIEDFKQVDCYLEHNIDSTRIIAFRNAFGKVVSYDNLGMQQETEQSLQELQNIADHAGCDDCIDDRPCLGKFTSSLNFQFMKPTIPNIGCKNNFVNCAYRKNNSQGKNPLQNTDQDDYRDILGPNIPPSPDWCEEIVVGTGRAMEVIAGLAPNYAVKAILIGIIEALITRCLKCCKTGEFWKACVAPIARKWREWTNNKENHLPPNANNLPLYAEESI